MGLGGAVATGLGSILGTGAFVAIGVASGTWGDAVLLAVPLAGAVAVFNGLSSAHLAGRFPVAGGTYEYGYQTLGPWWGFTAGWLFLLAKTASAATAALGVALYLGIPWDRRVVAVAAVVIVTGLVLAGLRRTIAANAVLVTMSVAAIAAFGVTGLVDPAVTDPIDTGLAFDTLLPATAFLFVAYTGYGRIATLGEEVHRPERVIPRAVIVTLAVSVVLYALVELGGRAAGGPNWGSVIEDGLTPASLVSAPLSTIWVIGAVTAMLGALLNLVLGLSRVWLAMGRRGDMPDRLARLDPRSSPAGAVIAAGLPVAAVTLVGDISLAWSYSAFNVLLYYGLTNLSALALDRRRWTAWLGLGTCIFLSFFVPLVVWLTGAALIAVGLIWKRQRRS
jgi:APA family basic amino acid/polyamine antiporter